MQEMGGVSQCVRKTVFFGKGCLMFSLFTSSIQKLTHIRTHSHSTSCRPQHSSRQWDSRVRSPLEKPFEVCIMRWGHRLSPTKAPPPTSSSSSSYRAYQTSSTKGAHTVVPQQTRTQQSLSALPTTHQRERELTCAPHTLSSLCLSTVTNFAIRVCSRFPLSMIIFFPSPGSSVDARRHLNQHTLPSTH